MSRLRLISAMVLAGVLWAGCDRPKHDDDDDSSRQTGNSRTNCISFNEKTGLRVPPEAAQRIGLKTADVAERKVASPLNFMAQVFDPAATNRPVARASAQLTRSDAETLQANQAVRVGLDSGRKFEGRIISLNRELDPTGDRIEVLLEITGADESVAMRSFVTVTVASGGGQKRLSVPRAALVQNVEGWFVYTLSGEHFVRTAVKVGAMDAEFAAITDGLIEGDQVVAEGSSALWLSELKFTKAGAACCPAEMK